MATPFTSVETLTSGGLFHDFTEGHDLAVRIENHNLAAKVAHAQALEYFVGLGQPQLLDQTLQDLSREALYQKTAAEDRKADLLEVAKSAACYVGLSVVVEPITVEDYPITEYYHSTGFAGTGQWHPREIAVHPKRVQGTISDVFVGANCMRVRPFPRLRNIPRLMNGGHFDVMMVRDDRSPLVSIELLDLPSVREEPPVPNVSLTIPPRVR